MLFCLSLLLFEIALFSPLRKSVCFGGNAHGMCGVGDNEKHFFPVPYGHSDDFSSLTKDGYSFSFVVAGEDHTFIIAENEQKDFKMYGFGIDRGCVFGRGESGASNSLNTYEHPIELFTDTPDILKNVKLIKSDYMHSLILTGDGDVYSWGVVMYNKKGYMVKRKDCTPQKIDLSGEKGVSISTGKCHALIATDKGNVYGWGCNNQFQYGVNGEIFKNHQLIPFTESITYVSAAEDYSLFLDTNGNVYFTGILQCLNHSEAAIIHETPFLIFDASIYGQALSMHAGNVHFLIRTNEGIFGMGCNELGCLQEATNTMTIPQKMNLPEGLTPNDIQEVFCKNRVSMILSTDGSLYLFGQDMSKPFLFGPNVHSEPFLLHNGSSSTSDTPNAIVCFDASQTHLVAVSKNRLYGLGDNVYYQCGTVSSSYVSEFKMSQNAVFEESTINRVYTSSSFAISITADGKAYSQGSNSFGQLGIGNMISQNVPYPIHVENSQYDLFFTKATINSQSGILIDDRGGVWVFGSNEYLEAGMAQESIFLTPKHHPVFVNTFESDDTELNGAFQVCKTDYASFVLSLDKGLYSFGYSNFGALGLGTRQFAAQSPSKIHLPLSKEEVIVEMACGFSSVLVRTRDTQNNHRVYSFGLNDDTVTCSLEPDKCLFSPQMIFTPPVPFSEVSVIDSARNFDLIIVNQTYAFIWGTINTTTYEQPTFFFHFPSPVVQCDGSYHEVCVLHNGDVYGWGNNYFHQLQVPEIFLEKPKQMMNITFNVSRVSASDESTILLESLSCFGVPDSNLSVCSGHGVCVGDDVCRCFWGYAGSNCELIACNGIDHLNKSVCHGHGSCVDPNYCLCDAGWSNINQKSYLDGLTTNTATSGYCSFVKCPLSKNDVICNGGTCDYSIEKGVHCNCKNGNWGDDCSITLSSTILGIVFLIIVLFALWLCLGFSCVFVNCAVSTCFKKKLLSKKRKLFGSYDLMRVPLIPLSMDDDPFENFNIQGEAGEYKEKDFEKTISLEQESKEEESKEVEKEEEEEGEEGEEEIEIEIERKKEKEELNNDVIIEDLPKTIDERTSLLSDRSSGKLAFIRNSNLLSGASSNDSSGGGSGRMFDEKQRKIRDRKTKKEQKKKNKEEDSYYYEIDDYHFFEGNRNEMGDIYFKDFFFREFLFDFFVCLNKTIRKEKRSRIQFSGHFKKGCRHGYGREFFLNGRVQWEGNYRKNLRDGKGCLYDEEGHIVRRGEWRGGMLSQIELEDVALKEIDFGKIKIGKKLGSGGFANVYQCEYKGNRYAIKLLNDVIMNHPIRRDQIFKKMKKVLKLCVFLNSANIIKVIAISKKNPHRIGYMMELCSINVAEWIHERKGNMIFSQKVEILLSCAQAMAHVHQSSIIHRDLKWENVLLKSSKSPALGVRLSDFDLATKDDSDYIKDSFAITERIGSVFYAAPQVLEESSEYHKKADNYSFAIMMFELLFETNNPFSMKEHNRIKCDICGAIFKVKELPLHIVECKLRPRIPKNHKYPKWIIELMKNLWSHEEEDRFSFEEICEIINLEFFEKETMANNNNNKGEDSGKDSLRVNKTFIKWLPH